MPFKLLGCPEASIEAHKTVIYDHFGKYDPFYMAVNDSPESAF
jgi:hypothetical protein